MRILAFRYSTETFSYTWQWPEEKCQTKNNIIPSNNLKKNMIYSRYMKSSPVNVSQFHHFDIMEKVKWSCFTVKSLWTFRGVSYFAAVSFVIGGGGGLVVVEDFAIIWQEENAHSNHFDIMLFCAQLYSSQAEYISRVSDLACGTETGCLRCQHHVCDCDPYQTGNMASIW